MVGIDAIIHLAGAEESGHPISHLDAEIEGTRVLAEAAADAGVKRILYLSHLGASPTSGYLLQRSKAYAEEHIRKSGVPYTILRTGIVFGRGDHFTTSLAMMLSSIPFIFPIPGGGETLLQPLWVEDLATALLWTIDDPATAGQIYEIGGPEYLSFRQIVESIMHELGIRRLLLSLPPPYLRAGAWLLERFLKIPPVANFWLDYLAVNRTADVQTLPAALGIQPSRLELKLAYLREKNWLGQFLSQQFRPRRRLA
jgi:NADH dehydrogenase